MSKRRLTPFARFFFALLIIVPGAFFAASYINQEDPMQTIKQWTGQEETPEKTKPTSSESEPEVRLEDLQKELRERDREISDLRQQLKNCQ